MQITLMTYNIERGFHSRAHDLEQHRLAAAQRIVKAVNPDILALTEACYGGENAQHITMNYQQLFEYPYSHFGGYPVFGPRKGDEGGNCLLSSLPMTAESVQLPYKGAVRGKITVKDEVLTVDVVHPSYSVSDEEKINTLQPLLTTYKAPYILTGDFNTVSPEDEYNWDVIEKELEEFNPKKASWIVDNWKNAMLIHTLQTLGLHDVFPEDRRTSTVPTFYTYTEQKQGVRMDFTFATNNIHTIDAYVVKNEDAEMASDHYPIVAVVEIET